MSPESFGATLGRPLEPGVDMFPAELGGFGRRWNYGAQHTVGVTTDDDGSSRIWTIVALGLVRSVSEAVNGVVAWVDRSALAGLDHRERHYDRVDVTDCVSGRADRRGPVVTYVPHAEAQQRVEVAKADGRAAIERRYWDLVDDAFAALGDDQRARYRATTPDPGVPILDLVRRPVD